MKSKIFKKIALCFASALVVCSVGAFAGCSETDHPEARITYEFNGAEYTVDYKLYRNMYPHTVKHFIELSDEGFYDNMIIHDYKSSDWFTGGYTYDEADYSSKVENNALNEYLEQFSKEDAYSQLFAANKLSPSVYSNHRYDEKGNEYVDSADVLPYVMGEFKNNINQEIEKGALTADYGCLKMFYYDMGDKETGKIYVTPTDDQIILADYKKNCATSIFALQTTSGTSYSERNYTVFAQLKETENFDKLVEAVNDYKTDLGSSDFCTTVKDVYVEVDVDGDKTEVSFDVPRQPIIIKSVKITKY